MHDTDLTNSLLGKNTTYKDEVDNTLLFAIPRSMAREKIGIYEPIPFYGIDIWNCYEFSWMQQNKFQFASLVIKVPAESKYLIESKSLKLYLYSFANSNFNSHDDVIKTISQDLTKAVKTNVEVELFKNFENINSITANFNGENIDTIDISTDAYEVDSSYLKAESNNIVTETLFSNLLRSNCLITGKPDWGSVKIEYTGRKICKKGLLKYLISYREHQGFHEQCVEQIFTEIGNILKPEKLLVEARYTRRGSLDINPIRTNFKTAYTNNRLYRQ